MKNKVSVLGLILSIIGIVLCYFLKDDISPFIFLGMISILNFKTGKPEERK